MVECRTWRLNQCAPQDVSLQCLSENKGGHEYASLESSASPRITDAALSSTDDSMQGPDLACNPEQLEYPARPITPDYPLQGSDLAGDLEQVEDPSRPITPD